jgi:hypothetical protein
MTATISAAQLHYHCLSDNNHSKNFSCSNALLSPFSQQISEQEFQMLNCIIVAKVSDINHSKSNFSCSIVLSSPKFLTTITARISEASN